MYDLTAVAADLQNPETSLFQAQQDLVRCFYHKLQAVESGEDPLFSMWKEEIVFCYGDVDQLPPDKIQPAAMAERYGFGPGEEIGLCRMVQSIQTFYSVLVKCIAYSMVDESPIVEFRPVLTGQAFQAAGVANYCYEDWFCWVVKYWDEEMEVLCRTVQTLLQEKEIGREAFFRTFRPGDLKAVYEAVLPREIRHALGEFYTPDWLADWILDKAVGDRDTAATRILDPTCGAGTFLLHALSRSRRESGRAAVEMVCGFDINALAVLTAKAGCLAEIGQTETGQVLLPVYHYDVINVPFWKGENLVVDTGCGIVCTVPGTLCRLACAPGGFDASRFLQALCSDPSEEAQTLFDQLCAYDAFNTRLIVNLLLNRIRAAAVPPAQVVVGNPPWINWEYLPAEYKKKSQHLWPAYGLFDLRGRDLSFSKEDISVLVTYLVLHRCVEERGVLCFLLKQALFKSNQNAMGFRRFAVGPAGTPVRVMEVEDLSALQPFPDLHVPSAVVRMKKGEPNRYPVPYRLWRGKRGFVQKSRQQGADLEAVAPFLSATEMVAFPASRDDPTSVWVNVPEQIAPEVGKLLGNNGYKGRTGVFTGGGNGVYYLQAEEKTAAGRLRVHNLVERAKRAVPQVEAEIEPDFVYPVVQGSDLSQWNFTTRAYFLCPHTPEGKMWPVAEEEMTERWPLTYAYLKQFRTALLSRKGFAGWEKEIQRQRFYAVMRVGEYTFSRYKVAWRYIAKSMVAAVITDTDDPFLGRRMCLPNEKAVYVATEDAGEAYYLCGILTSSPVKYCVRCYMNPTSISAHVIDKLNIPTYDAANPLHRRISALCLAGHCCGSEAERQAVQTAIDAAAGALYQIPADAVAAMRQAAEA